MEVVIVTGSSGFIGSAVVRRLARNFRIVGFDREGAPYPPPQAECVAVDLTSDETLKAAFERVRYGYGHRIASVVHLAAYYDFSGEPSPLYDEITVRGTGRLRRELQAFDVDQFVFSSTCVDEHRGWRLTLQTAVDLGIPAPAMSASLAYFDTYRTAALPQNLTEAQRDFFGAHRYRRIDRPDAEPVHTDWRTLIDRQAAGVGD